MTRGFLGCLVLAAGLLWVPSARAQGVAGGSIAGVVRDASGAVLPGVSVEASSPALIEKVRVVDTDAQGVYRIVDLRPGVYTVRFMLSGFSTFQREGIELATGFNATVNATLAVGALEETVTVTGAAPVVDIQNVSQQAVFSREVSEALPSNRGVNQYLTFIPGATYGAGGATAQDVGGNRGEDVQGFRIHGSRADDFQQLRSGMFFGTMVATGNRMTSVNPAVIEETAVVTSGAMAEFETGGAVVNLIYRDGGNTYRGSFAADFGHRDLQGDNLDDALRGRGFTAAPWIRERYDVGGGVGGPIRQDRLWFFASSRYFVTSDFFPGNFFNATHGTLFYTPDLTRPAYHLNYYRELTGRLTAQLTPKHKMSGFFTNDRQCNCLGAIPGGNASPEAAGSNRYWPNNKAQVTWTYPATNRLLFEAGVVVVDGVWNRRPQFEDYDVRRITDTARGYSYGSTTGPGEQVFGQHNEQVAMSYVTGSHNFKTGMQIRWGKRRSLDFRGVMTNRDTIPLNSLLQLDPSDPDFPISDNMAFTFRDRAPLSVTLFAGPLGDSMRLGTAAVFAQDQWTIRRLTLNAGLRFDSLDGDIHAVDLPAGTFVPARHFDAVPNAIRWTDLNPRVGAAYDLFGNGRTALKAFIGRYVNFEAFFFLESTPTIVGLNPANQMVTSATRTWNDANGDYIPQEHELGPLSNSNFGRVVRTTQYADDVTQGFGTRAYNWSSSVQLQHQLRDGVGINVGYFRTWYGNFQATDNLLVGPSDFDPYCLTAPTHPSLPGGGGNQICGFYDVGLAKFGQVDNLITQASHYGKHSDVYNGIDATITARFREGGVLLGGFSTGRQVVDKCYIVDSPEDLYNCRIAPPWSAATQLKFSVIYPLPWQLQASMTYQNNPGISTPASFVASNAAVAPSLGRNLAACGTRLPCNATATKDLIAPESHFVEPRVQQIDLRLSRIFRRSTLRVQPHVDIYNLLNANNVLAQVTRFGAAWRNATTVLGPRLVKLGVRVDF